MHNNFKQKQSQSQFSNERKTRIIKLCAYFHMNFSECDDDFSFDVFFSLLFRGEMMRGIFVFVSIGIYLRLQQEEKTSNKFRVIIPHLDESNGTPRKLKKNE